jgi:hypothetical protein
MRKFGSNTCQKEAKNSKNDTENANYAKRCETKQSETKQKFSLFVLQTEAKIMQNGLRFVSISHGSEKKIKRKRDTLIGSHGFNDTAGFASVTPSNPLNLLQKLFYWIQQSQ